MSKTEITRPDWDTYFMEITSLVATRSTCLRRRVGAVVVKDKRILTTGYNGAPRDLEHCLVVGCLRMQRDIAPGTRHELCRGIHAEQNAIIQAATSGTSIEGGVIYSTHYPCSLCIKMIMNAGIKTVYYLEGYPDELSTELAEEAGLVMKQLKKESA